MGLESLVTVQLPAGDFAAILEELESVQDLYRRAGVPHKAHRVAVLRWAMETSSTHTTGHGGHGPVSHRKTRTEERAEAKEARTLAQRIGGWFGAHFTARAAAH